MCKFYQGAEDKDFEKQLKKMFKTVHREKPESSRSVSWCFQIEEQGIKLKPGRNPKRHILWHCGGKLMLLRMQLSVAQMKQLENPNCMVSKCPVFCRTLDAR